MNRSVYEGKFLLNLLGGTLRQDDSFPVVRRMNWGRLYRIADYHEISSAIYLGMLSAGARVPAIFGERFFKRYQEAVRYGEVYEASELEILDAFQALKVPAVILESAAVRRLYHLPETAANSPLRLYIPEERYYLAKGYLIDLGYETDMFYKGFGEHMKRIGGFQIEIYHTLPFLTKTYKKAMKSLLDRAYADKNRPSLKVLSLESSYLFRLAEASYHFCSDNLRIRELLDLYLFYKLFYKDMNHRFLDSRIKELGIPILSQSLLQIADMWFSSRKETLFPYPKDSISLYDDMEVRILSNGTVGKDSITEAAKLRKAIQDAENREERAEKWRKWKKKWQERWKAIGRRLRWVFPDKGYMVSLYPELEDKGYLLPLYWMKRDWKLLKIVLLPDKIEEKDESGKTGDNGKGTESPDRGSVYSIEEIGYQADPFRKNGRKKVFYKKKKRDEEEENSATTAENPENPSEEVVELPLNEDLAFLSEEINENEEADEDKENDWNLWDFSAPKPFVSEDYQAQGNPATEARSVFGNQNTEHGGKLSEAEEERALAMLSLLLSEDGAPTLSEEELKENEKEVEEQYRKSLEGERYAFPKYNASKGSEEKEEHSEEHKKEEYATLDGREVKVQSWSFPKEKSEE